MRVNVFRLWLGSVVDVPTDVQVAVVLVDDLFNIDQAAVLGEFDVLGEREQATDAARGSRC